MIVDNNRQNKFKYLFGNTKSENIVLGMGWNGKEKHEFHPAYSQTMQ